jgi:hypothetical protein
MAESQTWLKTEVKNSKHQPPSSREIPSFKSQNIGIWLLMFLWSLEVGGWCFILILPVWTLLNRGCNRLRRFRLMK